jgi:UDP-N-acetylglucosamine:LPS N-acetylglucosamine transferase
MEVLTTMARLLVCWELGAGRGHLTPHLLLAKALRERGHEVVFAVRNLQYAETLLGAEGFTYFQAPTWIGSQGGPQQPSRSYPQVLLNVGFADADQLVARMRAWLALFDWVKPDALLVDHGPTALLAAHTLKLPVAISGAGFWVPPLRTPLPALLGELDEAVRGYENRALSQANAALERLGVRPLDQLAKLFDVDLTVLRTFAELDPYADRDPELYLPANHLTPGKDAIWPKGNGPKVFAYLKPGPMLAPVLTVLARRKVPALVCTDSVSKEVRDQYASDTLTITAEAYDMATIGHSCDLAIVNAGHATLVNLLLAGRPLVLIPQQLEQYLLAARVAKLGAGVVVGEPKQTAVDIAFEAVMQRPAVRTAAEAFAERHAKVDFAAAETVLAERVEKLLQGHVRGNAETANNKQALH